MSDPEVIYESYGNKLIGAGATGGGSSTQVQADWEQSDTTAPDYIKNKPSLSTVATSGDYGDLSNKPSTTSSVTSGSTALVTSGGVYTYVDTMITQALSGSY